MNQDVIIFGVLYLLIYIVFTTIIVSVCFRYILRKEKTLSEIDEMEEDEPDVKEFPTCMIGKMRKDGIFFLRGKIQATDDFMNILMEYNEDIRFFDPDTGFIYRYDKYLRKFKLDATTLSEEM